MFSYSLLTLTKAVSGMFYRFQVNWLSQQQFEVSEQVRLLVLLNHTSLFEPLFVRIAPQKLLRQISRRLVIPVADSTAQRPVVGRILTTIVPGMVPISRKRDDSWQHFLNHIAPESLVAILPEGRMKRANGLDKHGNPMTVRGGIADILTRFDQGKMLFVYSGGLHHVQTPGQWLPRLFKSIKVNLEMVDISAYKLRLQAEEHAQFVRNVIDDLQQRLHQHVPHCPQQPCNTPAK
jgi:1-acyl-sn-glycerol-3-phosphate acyltransferase